jgi:hypothetical protein
MLARGRERAAEAQRIVPGLEPMFVALERQLHAGAVNHCEPALDAGIGGERPVARNLREIDAQLPGGCAGGPGQQLARAPAAVAPGLSGDLIGMNHNGAVHRCRVYCG